MARMVVGQRVQYIYNGQDIGVAFRARLCGCALSIYSNGCGACYWQHATRVCSPLLQLPRARTSARAHASCDTCNQPGGFFPRRRTIKPHHSSALYARAGWQGRMHFVICRGRAMQQQLLTPLARPATCSPHAVSTGCGLLHWHFPPPSVWHMLRPKVASGDVESLPKRRSARAGPRKGPS